MSEPLDLMDIDAVDGGIASQAPIKKSDDVPDNPGYSKVPIPVPTRGISW